MTSLDERGSKHWVGSESPDGIGQGGGVAFRDDQAVATIGEELRGTARACGDDRRSAGHRLERDETERLLPEDREDEHVTRSVLVRELAPFDRADEVNAIVHAEARSQPAKMIHVSRVLGANHVERGLREVRQRVDGDVDTLPILNASGAQQSP
jgi:hypothetical protein